MRHIRIYAIVSVLAALVWIFAEGEVLQVAPVEIDVRLGEPGSTLRVEPMPGEALWTGRVTVKLEGSASRLDALRSQLADGVTLTAGPGGAIDVDPGEEGRVELREALRFSEPFLGSGVTLTEASPQGLRVRVDRIVERTARVSVAFPDGSGVGRAVVRPDRVTMRGPERLLSAAPENAELVARPSAEALVGSTPGESVTLRGVRLEPPEWLNAEDGAVVFTPSSVDITVTMDRPERTMMISAVQIHVREPAVVRSSYRVRLADGQTTFLADVTLRGPIDLIDQVGPDKTYQPFAEVVVQASGLAEAIGGGEQAEILRTARIMGLPPGVRADLADPASASVRLIVERASGED